MVHFACTRLAALLGGPCYCADITMFLSPYDPIWPRHLAPPSRGVCRAHGRPPTPLYLNVFMATWHVALRQSTWFVGGRGGRTERQLLGNTAGCVVTSVSVCHCGHHDTCHRGHDMILVTVVLYTRVICHWWHSDACHCGNYMTHDTVVIMTHVIIWHDTLVIMTHVTMFIMTHDTVVIIPRVLWSLYDTWHCSHYDTCHYCQYMTHIILVIMTHVIWSLYDTWHYSQHMSYGHYMAHDSVDIIPHVIWWLYDTRYCSHYDTCHYGHYMTHVTM
jgi:hypothetical protein